MSVLLRLLFAHILSDFFLQTDKMNKGKKAAGSRRWVYLLAHSAIHAVLAYLFVAQWCNLIVPLVIFVSHLAIDFVKSSLKVDNLRSFVLDQLAHLLVIMLLWLGMSDTMAWHDLLCNLAGSIAGTEGYWKLLLGYALMLKPSSIFMSILLKRWSVEGMAGESLQSAGQWIGYLERILIFTFIVCGSLESVGFLLAAKSIFRFGDLNKAQDIKMTEYGW